MLPESWATTIPRIKIPGKRVLILSDIHIPFHISSAIDKAIAVGRHHKVDTVLLNGDCYDMHSVSKYPHDGSKLTYQEEILLGREFNGFIRSKFPRAEIIFRFGNHEERLDAYLRRKASEIADVESIRLPAVFKLDTFDRVISEQSVINIGPIAVFHGHEIQGGGGDTPAKALWRQTLSKAIAGHHHRTDEYHEYNAHGKTLSAWTLGCLSGLHPNYKRTNRRWNHGFAVVHNHGSTAEVLNYREDSHGTT